MYNKTFPIALAVIFMIFFIILGISPESRDVWIAEVIPIIAVFLLLVLTYKKFQFSNPAYLLMSLWAFGHTIGAYYTFANVPFDFFNDLIGSERNQYDRVNHFIVGFYAFPMAEWLLRKGYCKVKLAAAFSLFFIMSVAAGYEIIEWLYAVNEGGEAGLEFLGSQGDIWDAQKDMLADTLGAVASLLLFLFVRTDKYELSK